MGTFKDLQKAYANHPVEMYDEEQEERLEKIKMYVYIGMGIWSTISDMFAVSKREERVRRRRRERLQVCVVSGSG
jgi:hypothetical protein